MLFNLVLGSLQVPFYIDGGSRDVPTPLKNKINKATSKFIENGLLHFYERFSLFIMDLQIQKLELDDDVNDDKFHALTMENLKIPVIFCSCLIGFAIFIIVLEIVVQGVFKI